MSNYGQRFHKIRKDKGLSLSDVAHGIMTTSSLSKFERGTIEEISFAKLDSLLNRMNVSYYEFFNELGSAFLNEFICLCDQCQLAFEQKNLGQLNALAKQEYQKWQETQMPRYKYNAIMIDSIHSNIDPSFIQDPTETQIVLDYLDRVETWYTYEICLYGNMVSSLTSELIYHLCHFQIKKRLKDHAVVSEMYLHTIINSLATLISRGDFELAELLLKLFSSLRTGQDRILENIYLDYLQGILNYCYRQDAHGRDQMKRAIEKIKMLELDNHLKIYKETLPPQYRSEFSRLKNR